MHVTCSSLIFSTRLVGSTTTGPDHRTHRNGAIGASTAQTTGTAPNDIRAAADAASPVNRPLTLFARRRIPRSRNSWTKVTVTSISVPQPDTPTRIENHEMLRFRWTATESFVVIR